MRCLPSAEEIQRILRSNELPGQLEAIQNLLLLCFGESLGAGLDSLLVTRGIHRSALHGESFDEPASAARLERLCREFGLRPVAAIGSLEG